jgi:hypothetical protein
LYAVGNFGIEADRVERTLLYMAAKAREEPDLEELVIDLLYVFRRRRREIEDERDALPPMRRWRDHGLRENALARKSERARVS